MRILVAPTAFKGSYSPSEVAKAMSEGISEFCRLTGKDINIERLPLADGGDGTVEALALSLSGKLKTLDVAGSLGEARKALYLELENCVLVELASACGIAGLKPGDLRPLTANSLGLGTVIRHVLENMDIENIVVAVGGSASTDGGSACIYELGAKFFDSQGKQFIPSGGGSLMQLARCDLSAAKLKLRGRKLTVVTDVLNPLLGKDGAACVFGPQKGASSEEVACLDQALAHYADLVEDNASVRLRYVKGSGAAGGTPFGLAALGATIVPGFEWLSNLLLLARRIKDCDLVITGEGRTDVTSLQGKVVGSLADLCAQQDKPLWIFSGEISPELTGSKLKAQKLCALAEANRQADLNQIKHEIFNALSGYFGFSLTLS